MDIPLLSPNEKSIERLFFNGKEQKKETKHYSTRLIYEKYKSGANRFFVVTLINKDKNNTKTQHFYKNGDFTGLMLISDLGGNFLASYNVENGNQQMNIVKSMDDVIVEDLHVVYNTLELNEGDTPVLFSQDNKIFIHCGRIYQEGDKAYCAQCGYYISCGSGGPVSVELCPNSECGITLPIETKKCPECGSMIIGTVNITATCGRCFKEYLACICCVVCFDSPCKCCANCHRYPCNCYNNPPPSSCCSNLYCNGKCQSSSGSSGSDSNDSNGSNGDGGEDDGLHEICVICYGCLRHDPETDFTLRPCTCPNRCLTHQHCIICKLCISTGNNGSCRFCKEDNHKIWSHIITNYTSTVMLFDYKSEIADTVTWRMLNNGMGIILNKHPIGKKLTNFIDQITGDAKLEINVANIATGNLQGKKVTISSNMIENKRADQIASTTYHELFHYLQQFRNPTNFTSGMANFEAEAKLAKELFILKNGLTDVYNDPVGQSQALFIDLCRKTLAFIDSTGNIIPGKRDSLIENFREIMEAIYDATLSKYKIDSTRTIEGNIETLKSVLNNN